MSTQYKPLTATDARAPDERWSVAISRIRMADPDTYSDSRRALFIDSVTRGDVNAIKGRLAESGNERMHAVDLWRGAILAEQEFERSIAKERGVLVQKAKDDITSGQKTNVKVEAKMYEMAPDQMETWGSKKADLHGAVRACEHLVDSWKKQPAILEALYYGLAGKN